MFPSIPLSSFSQTIPPSKLLSDNLDSTSFFNRMSFTYSIGLNKQLSELQSLSTQIFKDIYEEFVQVEDYVSRLQSRVATLKSKASILLNPNYSKDPNKFAKIEYAEFNDEHLNVKNSMNRLDTFLTDPEKVKPLSLVSNVVKSIQSASSIDMWKSIIPNENLEATISDPKVFITTYIADIKEQFIEIDQTIKMKVERTKSLKAKHKPRTNVGTSSIMIDKVLPLQQLLLDPPPPGMGSKNNDQIHFITNSEKEKQRLNHQSPELTQQQFQQNQQMYQQQKQISQQQQQISSQQRQLQQEQQKFQIQKRKLMQEQAQLEMERQRFQQEQENYQQLQQQQLQKLQSEAKNQENEANEQQKLQQQLFQQQMQQLKHDQDQLQIQKQQFQQEQEQFRLQKQQFQQEQEIFQQQQQNFQQNQNLNNSDISDNTANQPLGSIPPPPPPPPPTATTTNTTPPPTTPTTTYKQ